MERNVWVFTGESATPTSDVQELAVLCEAAGTGDSKGECIATVREIYISSV